MQKLNSLRKLDAFQIKMIMLVLMLLNHIDVIPGLYSPNFSSFITVLSRAVAPTFAFLVVEGIRHTKDIKKYIFRLAGFAAIMLIGNQILNSIFRYFISLNGLEANNRMFINNHIFITLLFGVLTTLMINNALDKNNDNWKKIRYILLASLCFIVGFFLEWGTVIILLMVVIYFFYNKKIIILISLILIQIISVCISYSEPLFLIALPFIFLYNGERGPNNTFTKYFFYVFYPLHLWIIYSIKLFITIN